MRSKKKGFKKVLAEFLCVALIACSIPGAAFAAEEENTGKGVVTSMYEMNDGISDGQKNVAGTEVKDTSDTGEQNTSEGDVKDPDGKTGIGGEVSEGEEGSSGTSGTETKESDSEKIDPKEKGGDGEEAGDTAQDPAKEDDESDGESTEDSADKVDAEDDAGSEDDTDIDSDDAETDTEDDADAEDEDEDESDVTDTAKGGSASSDDEEDEEDEDEEEEDWIDGPLDDDLMLLTATPSDATPVAEMDGEYYDTVQDAIDGAKDRSTITMVDDSTENIIISDGLILTLDLAGFILEGNSEGSVVTIIDAELTLEDSSGDEGRITGGSSDYGGGVYISDGTFRMTGGAISDNTADIYGGGVYLDSGTFTMTGGIICENTADTAGSDIYAEEGSMAIRDASDMMDGDYKWYEDGEDSRYSEDNSARVCDDEDIVGAPIPGRVRGLALVASDGIMPLADGVAQIGSTTYTTVQAAVDAAGSGSTITMIADSKENVTISSGKSITLDLAGHTLDGGQNGSVITNNGTLTVEDSGNGGSITNGYASFAGGGIYNSYNATLTLKGGTISGNAADSLGGGVYNLSTFKMEEDASISGNKASWGAGVSNSGDFTMSGGTISDNISSVYGGGVDSDSIFTMEDGMIADNKALSGGGVEITGTFTMKGGIISGNIAYQMGGGVFSAANSIMEAGTISGNEASIYGGGIFIQNGTFTMKGGAVHENISSSGGADFYSQGGSIALIAANKMSDDSGTDFTYYAWFNDWSSSSDPDEYTGEGISSEPVSVENTPLTAAEKGTLTYYVDGEAKGKESHKAGVSVTVKHEDEFNINNPHFVGWSTSEGSTTEEYVPGESYMIPAGDTCFYDAYSAHNYVGVVTKEPTCTEDGVMTYTCSICGDSYTESIAALGHNYSTDDVTFEWSEDYSTCTVTFFCTDCKDPAEVDCTASVATKEPTCTDTGTITYTVTATIESRNDSEVTASDIKEETVDALGHNYSSDEAVFEWDEDYTSCTVTFTCTVCSYEETVNCDIVSETVTEPTCTDTGSTLYTATATIMSRDGELTVKDEQTEEIKALGHAWEVDQTIIEDSEDRYEERVGMKCARCGLEYEEEIVVSTESDGTTAHSSLSWSDILSADNLAELFEAGAELDFKMTAAALSESDVPSADRTLVEDLIAVQWPDADYTASWLDISVLLDIIHSTGEEETREYSSTLNPLTITVTIPDELLDADGDTYAVIRIHEGEAAVLDTTDNGDGTLTFESDLFSSYVIVKTAGTDSGNGGSGSGSSRRHSSNNSYTGSSVSGTGSIAYSTGTWTIDELGHWRYTDSSGRKYENEWGYIYNPYADTSAGQPSASWFHFGYDGIMDTGWFIDTDGKMYYLNPSLDNTQGAMFTGWVFIDGKWYYFDASGALLRSTQTPDGYTVDETGARI